MAKTYTVHLHGKDYPLKYGARDAIALKKRFGKPIADLLRLDVMGFVEREKPNGKPGETVWVANGTHDIEVQAAFLHAGLSSAGLKVNEERVLDWIQEHMDAGQNLTELFVPVWKAAFLSGITGVSLDVDEKMAEAQDEEAEPEGKE